MLRRTIPVRSCTDSFSDYKVYRGPLQADFNRRCGYCDIYDAVLTIPFHIDHFAPVSQFPELKIEYSNLVYACPSCNRAKWDHWPMDRETPSHDGQRGFIDPCKEEYDEHLERIADGSIRGKTVLGAYICGRLKLQLRKHRFLWLLDRAIEQCDRIQDFLLSADDHDPDVKELKEKYHALLSHYHSYHRIIRGGV